jgi:uncharacterized membrane protein YhaH (DUF805 family)
MGFKEAIASGFKNYAKFSGRAARSEFWLWQLFIFLAAIVVGVVDALIEPDSSVVSSLWSVAVLVPSIAVAIRRLHDADISGWWLMLIFVPLVGFVMLIIWWIGEGTVGYNRFGADPRPKELSLHEQGRSLLRARTNTTD